MDLFKIAFSGHCQLSSHINQKSSNPTRNREVSDREEVKLKSIQGYSEWKACRKQCDHQESCNPTIRVPDPFHDGMKLANLPHFANATSSIAGGCPEYQLFSI